MILLFFYTMLLVFFHFLNLFQICMEDFQFTACSKLPKQIKAMEDSVHHSPTATASMLITSDDSYRKDIQ